MKGDILIVGENHRKAAQEIFQFIYPDILNRQGKFLCSIAGESGAGKSEIALALADLLDHHNLPAYIIQQDDFFRFPPKTNAMMREKDIRQVGPGEVRIDLINETLGAIARDKDPVEKPLVIFSEDRITSEVIHLKAYRVIILEGTYTTLADHIQCKVFIDRDLDDTREDRLKRNREKQGAFLEQVLKIEHEIISRHKTMADLIVTRQFSVRKNA